MTKEDKKDYKEMALSVLFVMVILTPAVIASVKESWLMIPAYAIFGAALGYKVQTGSKRKQAAIIFGSIAALFGAGAYFFGI